MSIRISSDNCIGCGKCCNICPGSLIHIGKEHKAEIKYPKNCWGCVSCVKECPVQAISFYLGVDIGGKGSVMTVRNSGHYSDWVIQSPDNKTQIITVDHRNANQY
jgi:adenylylsulfate reductase subunit B